jgi:hypothetical protein
VAELPRVVVQCAVCGASYSLSERNGRRHAQLGIPHLCGGRRCLGVGSGPTSPHARWWVAALGGMDEARAVARAIWGERRSLAERSVSARDPQ